MFCKISEEIAQSLADNGKVQPENQELCRYGIQQIFSILLNLLTTMIIGLGFGMLWQSVLFLLVYIPLRSYAGGYHAETPFRCYLFSVGMIIAVLAVLKYVSDGDWVYGISAVGSGCILWIFAPVEDRNKPLDALEQCVYRKRTRLLLCVTVGILFLLMVLRLSQAWHCIALSMLTLSVVLLAGKRKNDRMIRSVQG